MFGFSGATVEEDDIFMCGKCKKQFTTLSNFLNHKQGRCVPQTAVRPQEVVTAPPISLSTTNQVSTPTNSYSNANVQQIVSSREVIFYL